MSCQRECRMCGHYYHEKRPRCPACGTVPSVRFARAPKVEVAPIPPASACAFCTKRGAKARCRFCNALMHPACRDFHERTSHRLGLVLKEVAGGRAQA